MENNNMNNSEVSDMIERSITKERIKEYARKKIGKENAFGDRFHNSDQYCDCPCHGIFEFLNFFYKGCVQCQLEDDFWRSGTEHSIQTCECNFRPRLCSKHRGMKTKRAQ